MTDGVKGAPRGADHGRGPRLLRRASAWTAAVPALGVGLGVLLLAVWPSSPASIALSQLPGLAHGLAFPRPLGLVLLGWGGGVALFGLSRWRRGRAGGALRALTVGHVAAALAAVTFLAWPGRPPWDAGPAALAGPGHRDLRIVTFNTEDSLTAADLDDIVTRFDPDVIVLPEAGEGRATAAAASSTFRGSVHSSPPEQLPEAYDGTTALTSVLVRDRVQGYHQEPGVAVTYGSVQLRSTTGLPTVLGVHTVAPVRAKMQAWRGDLRRVVARAEGVSGPLILAGDFNATLRHGALADRSRLVDAAQQCGAAGRGTWPSDQPEWVATPIDHVFVTPDVKVLGCEIAQVGRSDHRALAVTLSVP